MIVSGRRSLDRELVKNFKKYGFVLYSDSMTKTGVITAHRLVVQIDSIAKVWGPFDMMITDEPKMTLTHIISMKQKTKNQKDDVDHSLINMGTLHTEIPRQSIERY